jgi:hypothetical protein
MSTDSELKKMMEDLKGQPLTVDHAIERCRKAPATFPELHRKIWDRDESELAMEARRNIMHRLIIRMQMTTTEGVRHRWTVHTRTVPGYQKTETVRQDYNLAHAKLLELRQRVAAARERLRSFTMILSPDVAEEIDGHLAQVESIISRVSRGGDQPEASAS